MNNSWGVLLLAVLSGYLLAVATYLLLQGGSSSVALFSSTGNGNSYSNQTTWDEEEQMMMTDEGGDENDEDQFAMVESSVTCIVLFLILLTIAFEKAKHHILHAADRNLKPTIEALFGEMTVLGFVSAISFTLSQLGVFSVLSENLFEEDETLLELFEFVHYFLFLIMVFFVGFVLLLVKEASQMEHEWRQMDKACKDPLYMGKLVDEQDNDISSGGAGRNNILLPSKSWLEYLYKSSLLLFCSNNKKSSSSAFQKDLLLFHGLRQEFLLERASDDSPYFPPAADNHRVDQNFQFGRYLNVCLGHTLGNVVEVYPITWCCFVVLTIVYYGILCLVSSNDAWAFAWIWAMSGWAVFLFGNYFDYHIETLLYSLAAPLMMNNQQLVSTTTTTTTTTITESSISDARLLEETDGLLPAWCHIDIEKYKESRSFLVQWISPSPPTRRDALYWLEKEGPRLYLIIFQFRTVFLSAYYALLLLSFYPAIFKMQSSSSSWSWSGGIAYVIFSLIPAILLKLPSRRSVSNMAIASNLGDHRRPHFVSSAIRAEKTEQIIRSLVIIEKMHRAAASSRQRLDESSLSRGELYPPGEEGSSGYTSNDSPIRAIDSQELGEVARIFNTFDASGDGAIQLSEFEELLLALGVPMTKQSIKAMFKQLDTNRDGEVSREEFLTFYTITSEDPHGDSKNLHELGRFIFQLFDRDGSGGVTLSEFKAVLDALNVGFDIDEIGELVNELDERNRGTVGEREFIELLERNAHLFEKSELPPITISGRMV